MSSIETSSHFLGGAGNLLRRVAPARRVHRASPRLSRCSRSLAARAVAFAFVAALAGCSSTPARLHYGIADTPDGKRLLWPPEPDPPRYQYAGELVGEQNFVRDGTEARNVLVDVLKWIAGLAGGDEPTVLQRPQAVVGDAEGRVFVTDTSKPGVFVFDKPAGELRVWQFAFGTQRFTSPIGIALAPGGGVFVADADLALVARLDAEGRTQPPIGEGVLKRPTGVAFDRASGLLYVADTYDHDVKVFGPDGSLVRRIGTRGEAPGEFNYPSHIALARGELYVADTMNARVQVVPLGGGPARVIGTRGLFVGNLVRPKGVSVDTEGNVYVIESYYDRMLVYNREGQFLMPIGGAGRRIGQFFLPAGIWVDSYNRVFIADTFNGRVSVFQFLGSGGADEE